MGQKRTMVPAATIDNCELRAIDAQQRQRVVYAHVPRVHPVGYHDLIASRCRAHSLLNVRGCRVPTGVGRRRVRALFPFKRGKSSVSVVSVVEPTELLFFS